MLRVGAGTEADVRVVVELDKAGPWEAWRVAMDSVNLLSLHVLHRRATARAPESAFLKTA